MADIEVRIPNIGDFRDVPVLEVLVRPGDVVGLEDPLVELESEKATMEVPSPSAGVVRTVVVRAGDKVSEGSPILTLAPTDAQAAPTEAQAAPTDAQAAPTEAPAPPAVAETPVAPAAAAPPAGAQGGAAANGVVHASPSVRRFARELGVDLHAVTGTGPHERVTRDDVQDFVKRTLAAPTAPTAPARSASAPFDLPPWPKPDFARYGEIETVPLSRIRKLSGPNLHRNWVSIPHVTNDDEADVTELEAFRKALNAENAAAKVTMLAFIIKAAVVALGAHPDVNSSLDGDMLVRKKYYNIGFAADTPQGLVVPVLKGADTKGVLAVARETAELAARARDGKLSAADMSGATFTISSLGGIGGTSFTPIINAPEVAILGVSRSAVRPVWDGAAFVPRLMLPLSLSYDHRVIDGALAARFNATLTRILGDLRRAML
jgi:pyruvate dehydrogenase E2 component (dihydrolipoamide acetyltransferase)